MKVDPMTQHSLSPKLERDRSHHDRRRVEQAAWASWYRSPIWKSIRRHRLAEEPQCRECAIEGRTVAARATLITSNLTGVTGPSSCDTRTPKAYVFVTATLIGIQIDRRSGLGF